MYDTIVFLKKQEYTFPFVCNKYCARVNYHFFLGYVATMYPNLVLIQITYRRGF